MFTIPLDSLIYISSMIDSFFAFPQKCVYHLIYSGRSSAHELPPVWNITLVIIFPSVLFVSFHSEGDKEDEQEVVIHHPSLIIGNCFAYDQIYFSEDQFLGLKVCIFMFLFLLFRSLKVQSYFLKSGLLLQNSLYLNTLSK